MAKLAKRALGTLGVAAAVWTGGWFYGKSALQSRVDSHVAEWGARGVAVSYKALEIGGFPFSYRGEIIEPRAQSILRTALGPARSDWRTSVVKIDSALSDFGVVSFAMPDDQRVRLTPINGAPPTDIAIRSSGIVGKLVRTASEIQMDGGGQAIEIAVSPPGDSSYAVTVDSLAAAASAPADGQGQVSATLELDAATVDGAVWDLLDPAQSFPRDPANIVLKATAGTAPRGDNTLEIKDIQVEHVAMDIAGISLQGDGAATVTNNVPEGALTLRLQGLGDFIGNAANAGFLPEKQAGLYRVMIDSFAKKGEREGEQIYTVAFRNGFTFVNGAPTFIPAPRLP
jgi:hypothetical protein